MLVRYLGREILEEGNVLVKKEKEFLTSRAERPSWLLSSQPMMKKVTAKA